MNTQLWNARHSGSGWLPIETAPKDGGEMLLYNGYVCIGYWHGFEKVFCSFANIVPGIDVKPTHWMPLPDPPDVGEELL